MNWFFSKTYKHKCPGGTIRVIHKNIDSSFPLALKDIQTKFNADLEVQKDASAKLSADYASKIQSLLFSIDEQSQSLMMNLRFAYIAFQSNGYEQKGIIV